jgi:hypothetical protein
MLKHQCSGMEQSSSHANAVIFTAAKALHPTALLTHLKLACSQHAALL